MLYGSESAPRNVTAVPDRPLPEPPQPPAGRPLSNHDVQLAAYLSMVSHHTGDVIEGELAHRLRETNDAMAQVRRGIDFRANYDADFLASEGKVHHTGNILRSLLTKYSAHTNEKDPFARDHSIQAALTLILRSGKCSEYAHAAKYHIAHTAKSTESVSVVKAPGVDHCFVIQKLDASLGGRTIAADAWARGPATLAEHNTFFSNGRETVIDALSSGDGRREFQRMMQQKKFFEQDAAFQTDLKKKLAVQQTRCPQPLNSPRVLALSHFFSPSSTVCAELTNPLPYQKKGVFLKSQIQRAAAIRNTAFGVEDAARLAKKSQIQRAAAIRNIGFGVKDAAWFANRKTDLEARLLHCDLHDLPAQPVSKTDAFWQ